MKGVEDIYPLSPMQQGMLFHALYAPDSGAYIEHISSSIDGDLDLACFEEAWRRVLARHPILRTAFLWEGLDEPVQVVREAVDVVSDYQDWRGLSPQEREARLGAFLNEDRRRGFELSQAPLTRYLLAKTGETTHEFVWTFHHLILDGWSIPLVLRDFFVAYQAVRSGEEIDMPAPRPFRDYVEWLQEQHLPDAAAFWRRTLGGFPAPTPLGVDLRSGEVLDHGDAVYQEADFTFSAEITARLESFSRQQQVTLNTLVLGAWALLLSRYSGQTDVVIGATVSGRSPQLADANDMVGMFVNTLPVRARIETGMAVADWLKTLQGQLVEARQYEHSPLVQVHGWSDVPRGLPLFESIVSFQNQPIGEVMRNVDFGLKVRSLVVHHTRTTYPLTIVVEPGDALSLVVVFDSRRFEEATVARLSQHLETLLADIAADPARPISGLSIMPPAERRLLVQEFNDPSLSPPISPSVSPPAPLSTAAPGASAEPAPCLHHLFERQAAAAPDRTALVAGDERLSYGELNARANRLAHYLRGLGVGPEVIVGLCLERSADMIVAILGVLKAGGAYLPLDPNHPRERLTHMLEDSGAPVLLTQQDYRDRLASAGLKVVDLKEAQAAIGECGADNPVPLAGPDNLIYVIYTSGSTGAPKGVLLTHGNAARLFDAANEPYGFGEADVWTMFHSYAFDFSVWEMWGALRYGGRLVVVPEETSQSPRALYDLLAAQDVTVLSITPSVFREFLGVAADLSEPLKLRLVIFGGEALDLDSLTPWFDRHGFDRPRLVNMYGITETTVHVTYRPISADDYPSLSRSPIGAPLSDLQTYILDTQMRPVPVNVPGELYVGGSGLARGYLNRPGLTAERFAPNPFSAQAGARLYRTGDRARFVGDLEIDYLGRADNQMKIRGFRIEAGEVEAAIRRHEAVRDVAVVAYEEAPGDARLVAHIVPRDGATLAAGELRGYLSESLPAYMIPSRFMFADGLPMTPSGKIDRRALPAPGAGRPEIDQAYVAPRNELEQELAAIWSEILGAEKVGIYDDFFELGGHSLLATRLISRVRETFEVDLPLSSLFEVTTIDGLAVAILSSKTEQENADVIDDIFAEFDDADMQQSRSGDDGGAALAKERAPEGAK